MTLPENWVNSIFDKLGVRYGTAFIAMYGDADTRAVKMDWAEVLGGFVNHPDALKYALDHLPCDKPPNATQFRAIARLAPPEVFKALNEPKADPGRVRDALAAAKSSIRRVA
jgi:hypothetical protein